MKMLIVMLLGISASFAIERPENCDVPGTSKAVHDDLMEDINSVTEAMYKKAIDLKVNYDGAGSLAVHYDKQGKPKLLKLTYKSKKGVVSTKVLTFGQLMKGEPLWYENKDIKGKAIIVEKSEPFVNGNIYQFKFRIRTSMKPEYETHDLVFNADPANHSVSNDNKKFTSIVISPGIRMFSWDGTFKGVEFN